MNKTYPIAQCIYCDVYHAENECCDCLLLYEIESWLMLQTVKHKVWQKKIAEIKRERLNGSTVR